MKKACLLYKLMNLLLFVVASCFFYFQLTSCGLENYIIIDEPLNTINQPSYSDIDNINNYFDFWTNESNSDYQGDFKILGTEVYYKIYSSSTTLQSEVDSLNSLANNSTSSASAADKLRNLSSSGGYGYKSLKAKGYTSYPLIKFTGEDQRVYIRLTNYQTGYPAKIAIGGKNGTVIGSGIPIRNTSDNLTFDFGRKGSSDKKPLSSDEDVKYSSEPIDEDWYVAMFAVAVGRDSAYSSIYSNILYLGSVTISAKSEDN